jgi:glucokinase
MKANAIIALESGGTKLVAGVSDAQGVFLQAAREARPPGNRASDTLEQLIKMARGFQTKFDSQGYNVGACGFGFGGSVKRSTQLPYLSLHEEGWSELDARAILEKELQIPVYIENDCKVAALAEAVLGAGVNASTVFYMTVGTGIGGGFIRDGHIMALSENGESEVGHLPLEPEGPLCGCGAYGCLEALAAGPGIFASAKGDFGSTEEIFSAWNSGDSKADLLVERAAAYIARGIGCVMALYHPECVVIGGGVASGNPRFVKRIAQLSKRFTVPYFREGLEVRTAKLGEYVVIQGAALFALSQIAARDAESTTTEVR